MALLEIEDLHVDFPSQAAVMHAVEGVSIAVDEVDVLGIVGESSSAKSVSMLAVMGLIAWPGRVPAKRLVFAGRNLRHCPTRSGAHRQGIAMILEDPTTSLDPCFTIGFQLAETLRLDLKLDPRRGATASIQLLEQVGIPRG